MTEIYDLNNNEINYYKAGSYGGNAGNKDAILWNGDTWMIKYPKSTKSMDVEGLSYTTAPLSEYIGSHIYDLLGINVHKTELGVRNGKVVVACKDFCNEGEILKEFRTIKNSANKYLAEKLDEEIGDSSDITKVNLNELLLHFKYNEILTGVNGVEDFFWKMAVIDVFINNNDRNNGNWGLIYSNGQHKIAPVFDNGASFSNKTSDKKIKEFLCDYNKLRESALNGRTVFYYNEKQLTAKKLIEFENESLKKAIKEVVPIIEDCLEGIISFIYEIPTEHKGYSICSDERKLFYTEGLKIRLKELLQPAFHDLSERENKNIGAKAR